MGKIQKVIAWSTSRQGATEIAALVGALGTIYKSLQNLGVL